MRCPRTEPRYISNAPSTPTKPASISCSAPWGSNIADVNSRRGKQLDPEESAPRSLTRRVGKTHFGEPRVHYVFAVTGTIEPPLDNFFDGLRAVGNVLADQFFPVANRANPIRG